MYRKMTWFVLAGLLCAGQTWADDIHPPNWRGNALTTWQAYEFLAPGNPINDAAFLYETPDAGYTPVGNPLLTHIPGPGAGWHEKQPTAQFGQGIYAPPGIPGDGWINLSGDIIIEIPNFINENPRKQIWIQLTWEPQAPGNVPTVEILDPPGGGPSTIPLVRSELWPAGSDPVNPWRAVYHDVWHLELFPNPPLETIKISGGINVDELIIDTWCVPEPAGLTLLAIGGLLMAHRRKT